MQATSSRAIEQTGTSPEGIVYHTIYSGGLGRRKASWRCGAGLVQLKRREWLEFSRRRHQMRHLEFKLQRLFNRVGSTPAQSLAGSS